MTDTDDDDDVNDLFFLNLFYFHYLNDSVMKMIRKEVKKNIDFVFRKKIHKIQSSKASIHKFHSILHFWVTFLVLKMKITKKKKSHRTELN